MTNWWANKLGAPAAAPRAPQYEVPRAPTGFQPPPPFGAPPGYQQPAAPEAPPVNAAGEVEAGYAIRAWSGTRDAQADQASCPSCGSFRFMSRQSPETAKITSSGQTVYPAPECFECGYPKHQGSLGAAAKPIGGTAPSRQGAMPEFTGLLSSLGKS